MEFLVIDGIFHEGVGRACVLLVTASAQYWAQCLAVLCVLNRHAVVIISITLPQVPPEPKEKFLDKDPRRESYLKRVSKDLRNSFSEEKQLDCVFIHWTHEILFHSSGGSRNSTMEVFMCKILWKIFIAEVNLIIICSISILPTILMF